jgi:hypothetical protein
MDDQLDQGGGGKRATQGAHRTEAKAILRDRLIGGGAALSSLEGAPGEKLMPAWFAAHCGELQNSEEGCSDSRNVLRRNALQIEVTAKGTVGVKQMANGNQARMKSRPTGHAAPRPNTCSPEDIIESGSPPGTPDQCGIADRTFHLDKGSGTIFPASAFPTFCDKLLRKLFSASWPILKFPMFPIVGTALG